MIKKIASDSIAQEMFLLLKRASKEEDQAMTHHEDSAMTHHEDSADEDNLEDYLMSDVEDNSSTAESYVDDLSDNLMRRSDEASDEANDAGVDMLMASASDMHLMNGLGKIEASLRSKGEGFAADLVRTTALSIREDIVKQAGQKNYVLKNLVKMALDLDQRGEKVASGLIKDTIRKIN
jgi:hypothetical protein